MNEFNIHPGMKLAGELRKLYLQKKYDMNGASMVFSGPGLVVGGVFEDQVWEHPAVITAQEEGDVEKEMWLRNMISTAGRSVFRDQYVQVNGGLPPNLIVNDGLDFVLNVLFYSTTKISTWYYGPFTSNWTPAATADSSWAGVSSGPLATELPNASFDESNRQAAVFGSAASSQSITTSSTTDITIATGISGVSIYGHTLNEIATVAYNSTDKILLAATRRSEALTGLAAGTVLKLGYTFGCAST